AIEGFPETLRLQVLHCILSHHGELTNGSPVVPKTLEALVLYHLDNLDAQTDAFSRLVAETRDKGQAWSEYITMIDRQVWTKDGL
ncbi:MAG: hydrolase, partial [Candidatus Hydrogenedentes bacterium]|nr:hydrolase [Candidatus Hydrogenedentota bacterium]